MEKDPDFRSPPKKRKRQRDCVTVPSGSKHFLKMSEKDMASISKRFVPPNTQKNTGWAISCFREWRSVHNASKVEGERLCRNDLLENPEADDLNYGLARFVAELRNQSGEPYSPRSIHQILCGVQRYNLEINPTAPRIMDKDDPRFQVLRSACDNVFRQLRAQGIGTEVRHAPIITAEEEEKLMALFGN